MPDTSMAPALKACKACHAVRPLEDFPLEPRNRDGRSGRCRECTRLRHSKWAKENPERVVASRQKYRECHAERDRQQRTDNAVLQGQKRREARALARIERGLWPLPDRMSRYDDDGKRLCTDCRKRKPVEAFGTGRVSDGRSSYCLECCARRARITAKAATADRREKARVYAKKYDVRRLYGISLADAEAMLTTQGGACAICREKLSIMARKAEGGGAIDHCHSTGVVRGVLCIKCNSGLGQFRDSEEHLMAALLYLRRSRQASSDV